jgi:hypothetical protein
VTTPTTGVGRAPLLLVRASHEDSFGFALRIGPELLALLAALERVHAFGRASGVSSIEVRVALDGHARLHADRRAYGYEATADDEATNLEHDHLRDRLEAAGQLALDERELPEAFAATAVRERVDLVLDNDRGHFSLETSWGDSPPEVVYSESFDAHDLASAMSAHAAPKEAA